MTNPLNHTSITLMIPASRPLALPLPEHDAQAADRKQRSGRHLHQQRDRAGPIPAHVENGLPENSSTGETYAPVQLRQASLFIQTPGSN
jgi:hypothetical protein